MKKLASRIDGAIEFFTLPSPKRMTRHRGIGVVANGFVGVESMRGNPILWRATAKGYVGEPLGAPGHKGAKLSRARGNRIAGWWDDSRSTTKTGAVVWTVDGDTVRCDELDGNKLATWYALGVDGATIVGYGVPKGKPFETRDQGLVWKRGAITALQARPDDDVMPHAVDGDDVIGWYGRTGAPRAGLWRDGELIALAPDRLSRAIAGRDGEQVGEAFLGRKQAAVMWRGSSSSMIDLSVNGHEVSSAWGCARGLQVGFIREKDSTTKGVASPESRAVVWAGSPDDVINLHDVVGDRWNASYAHDIDVDGDLVTVIGTVEEHSDPQGMPACAAQSAAVWRFSLSAGA